MTLLEEATEAQEKTKHTEEKDILCIECNKAFSRRHSLIQHIKGVHKKIRSKKEICNICDKELCSKWSLNYHITSKHATEKDV